MIILQRHTQFIKFLIILTVSSKLHVPQDIQYDQASKWITKPELPLPAFPSKHLILKIPSYETDHSPTADISMQPILSLPPNLAAAES
jgi:hypothetical protein